MERLSNKWFFINTWEASINEVNSLICSLGCTLLKNTDVIPEPHTEEDLVTSMHLCRRTLGSFGGILMGKQGGDKSQVLFVYKNELEKKINFPYKM